MLVYHRVYRDRMPTTRQRYLITESDDLAAALDTAATQWPDLSRSQLLVKLALTAAGPLEVEARRARRLAAHEQLSGSLTGVYPQQDCLDYLEELRKDWPA